MDADKARFRHWGWGVGWVVLLEGFFILLEEVLDDAFPFEGWVLEVDEEPDGHVGGVEVVKALGHLIVCKAVGAFEFEDNGVFDQEVGEVFANKVGLVDDLEFGLGDGLDFAEG